MWSTYPVSLTGYFLVFLKFKTPQNPKGPQKMIFWDWFSKTYILFPLPFFQSFQEVNSEKYLNN